MTQPLRLLSDDPIRDRDRDRLGLSSWAEVVAGAALGTEGPLTIGVFGSWGVGKTSVLYLAKSLIDSSEEAARQKITTVLFNAWQYEREAAPLVPLIASILQELERKGKSRSKPVKNLRTALRSALYGMSAEVRGGIPMLGEATLALDAEKSVQRFDALRSQWIDRQMESSLYFNAFNTLREAQRNPESDRHKVVVFIDDLDRCFPNRAIRLLESIKLVLSEPGFIFVLGVDRSVLERYLEKRFSKDFGFRDYQRGQAYLAKFIQLPLWIPAHSSRFLELIERLVEDSALAQWRQEIVPHSHEISLACGYNPRQLVRFLNDLLVDRFIFQRYEDFPFRIFIAARGVRLQSEVVYHGLIRLPEICGKLHGCGNVEAIRQMISSELDLVKESDFLYDILLRIQGSDELTALLASEAGKEWLESSSRRSLVEDVLMVREVDDSKEFQEWVQAGTLRALQQISTDDFGEIMAGCHWFSQFPSSSRNEAIAKLRKLLSNPDPRIAEEAQRTLDTVYSSQGLAAAGV